MKRKIYNLNHGTIEIYPFLPDLLKLTRYRCKQFQLIPSSERILIEQPPLTWFSRTDDVVYSCEAFSLIRGDSDRKKKNKYIDDETILMRYCLGGYMDNNVNITSFLSGKEFIYLDIDEDKSFYPKKIQLTGGLLLDYLLFNEDFTNKRLDTDLSIFRGLYLLSDEPIDSINMDQFNSMFENGLISDNKDDVMEVVEASSKVYRKIR